MMHFTIFSTSLKKLTKGQILTLKSLLHHHHLLPLPAPNIHHNNKNNNNSNNRFNACITCRRFSNDAAIR